jgi:hypothetical protein
MSHFAGYRGAMIRHTNSNSVERRLNINDRVLLKIDFDNNTNGRRNAFDSFFSDEVFLITEILNNNMIQIKDEITGEIHNVFANRLKKL